ncbi:putative uncharacterized protein DDB_G0286901 [Condylostylus longicornis]|uniref:putative uncharacterized protein DDB_G0286901 n=1 Tax=Condylostylus longicornis TaxID=2530218 RepID=UPI00244DA9A0|nr:putative uncharacterized protein DDB_G0286901 [Condylostylus longicornis]
MENSTIFSLIFGSSTTSSPIKTRTEDILINNNNDNDNTVTSQLIISPSSSSLLNIINNYDNNNIITTTLKTTNEYTTSNFNNIAAELSNTNNNINDNISGDGTIESVINSSGSASASAASAIQDLWSDQQITFEIPSSNDLEKINNLDNFTNLFHRIINNAQQQQQQLQQQQQHQNHEYNNIIDNHNNINYHNYDNNNNRLLFNTHFDTNGSPVINLADLKTNYDNDGGSVSLTDDLFNLNNFNNVHNDHNNINLLNDNNINSLENLLFGNINMQNLINYLWIGVVTSLIILSVIFIIFSCYFYRKFKEWKKCNKDIRSQMTSTEFYHSQQYGTNNNGITVCNGNRITGTNETGYYQMESPPCYTIATGLPSYDEALLYFTTTNNNHHHHHHHNIHHSISHSHHNHHHQLLLHHNNNQYHKSLQCENQYEKHKEFRYIFINDSTSTSRNLSENSIITSLNQQYNNNNGNAEDECNSIMIDSENHLSQLNLSENLTVNNCDNNNTSSAQSLSSSSLKIEDEIENCNNNSNLEGNCCTDIVVTP